MIYPKYFLRRFRMRPASVTFVAAASLVGTLMIGPACSDPIQTAPTPAPIAEIDPNAVDPAAGGEDPDASNSEAVMRNYLDEDFVESPGHRDPFRNYAASFKVRPIAQVQREVVMSTVAIDDMRLSAIITGTAQPRAMLVDPTGVGYVVKRGDFLGRAEIVQTGGASGMPVTLNWRVDRIRDNEVVLSRDDPTAADRPPLTRVVPLYDENEERTR